MTENYRARATRAEQENARLKVRLSRQPNHQWFVDLVRKHLGQQADVKPAALARQVLQLKQARGEGMEKHVRTTQALHELWRIISFSDNDTCMCGAPMRCHVTENHSFISSLAYRLEGWDREYDDIVKEICDDSTPEKLRKDNDQ